MNNSSNNYYTKVNSSTDVFNLRSIINNMFNPYLKNHHIDINNEIEKYEKEKNEKEKENLSSKVKIYGTKTREKMLNKNNNNNENNNEEGEGNKRNRRHHNYYVVDEKKNKNNEKGNIIRTVTNCKRKSMFEKIEEKKRK